MERPAVIDLIRSALAQVLGEQGLADQELSEQTRLFDELALDSTSVIELLIVLEGMADIDVRVDELEHHVFETVGTLADFLLRMETVG